MSLVRLQAACPQEIPVNVMDLDEDEIRCRYKKTELGEFLQLNEVRHLYSTYICISLLKKTAYAG